MKLQVGKKGKFSLCVIENHVMIMYGGVDVYLHALNLGSSLPREKMVPVLTGNEAGRTPEPICML
jgi:hypothetical protein